MNRIRRAIFLIVQNNFIFLNVGEIRPYVLPSNSTDTQVIPLSHRTRARVSPAPIGTSRAPGNRRHTGRQEFLILHTRSRNAPITIPGECTRFSTYARHIPRLARASRPLVGVSPVCFKPPYAALLSFSSLFPLTSPSSAFPFSFSLPFSLYPSFLSLSLSLSISLFVR